MDTNETEFYQIKIVIAGAGGHGRVLLDILRNNHQFEVVAFFDADNALHGKIIDGLEVIGDLHTLDNFQSLGIGGGIIAIGDNRIRQAYAKRFEKNYIPLVSAIHPSATMVDTATVGKNVTIAAGANIWTYVTIENSAIVNTGAIVDHESHIQKASHICPGDRVAGHVVVRPGIYWYWCYNYSRDFNRRSGHCRCRRGCLGRCTALCHCCRRTSQKNHSPKIVR
jgi:sugar O-acyltransferase (sialic acid O-acetyltransferase NeuD family)